MTDPTLAASYSRDFAGHLEFGRRPALIVIDPAQGYVEPGAPLYAESFAAAVPVIAGVLDAARDGGVPVFFTQVLIREDPSDPFYRKLPALRCFFAGNPHGRFIPALAPRADERVLTKHYASAFFGTTLAEELAALEVDTLVMTGFSTSGCIRATAIDTVQHRLVPVVVRDGCADRHPAPHEANLFDIQAKYGEVMDAATVIPRLRAI